MKTSKLYLSLATALFAIAIAPALRAHAQVGVSDTPPVTSPAAPLPSEPAPAPAPAAPAPATPAPAAPTPAPSVLTSDPSLQAPTTMEVPAPVAPEPAPNVVEPLVTPEAPTSFAAPTPAAAPQATPEILVEGPLAGAPGVEPQPAALRHRRFSTREGSTGGISLEEPGSGLPGAVRLQLALDVAPADDFMVTDNDTGRTDKTLSVSWTALQALEIFASIRDRNTTQTLIVLGSGASTAGSLYAQGALLGFKLFAPIGRIFDLGGSLRFAMQNELGSATPLLKATSIGLRAAASADFREVHRSVPLIARLNLDYLFDNSAAVVEDTENARYDALGNTASRRNETRHLISRVERYSLDINRVDRFTLGLGLEAPIAIAEDMSLHPMLEWKIGVPVNRQAFDCAVIRGAGNNGRPSGNDTCLGSAGTDTWPASLALGLRFVPPVRGLSVLFALDLGLSGTSVFVRELAPTAPFALVFGLGYDYDAAPSSK